VAVTIEADPAVWVDAIAGSHDRLCELAGDLDGAALRRDSYCTGWSIANVLSHLGSGAELMGASLDAVVSGDDAGDRVEPSSVWARWDAMTPEEQRDGFLAADGKLVERLEDLGDGLEGMRFTLGPLDLDAVGFLGARLSEHAVHTWDVEVSLDAAAVVDPDAVALLVDRLPRVAAWSGKPEGAGEDRPFSLTVETSDPERHFVLGVAEDVTLEPVAPAPSGPGAEASSDLKLPAEAFLRLVYGRLDPAHTPPIDDDGLAIVERLRRVFPGL